MNAIAENRLIADTLDEVARLLEHQGGNPFRVRAYRMGAQTVRSLDRPVSRILADEGPESLERLPAIGRSLASTIKEVLYTGRLGLLQRLRGEVSPEDLFTRVPGIGEALARRICDTLGIETLEELEVAAHDGRLEQLPGVGPRRGAAVRNSLDVLLGRSMRQRARRIGGSDRRAALARPAVDTLLAVDAEYRERAARGDLPRIAPRRFNLFGECWLPVLHTERDGWSFTALFSNTALAHSLGRTDDWVVLYYERGGDEDQCTIVTESRGSLAGQRVVRARDAEARSPQRAA